MSYNWEKIFKDKDEKELVTIYSGKSHLNFEATIYAGIELKNRGFDIQKMEIINNGIVLKLKQEISDFEEVDFFKSKYFKKQFFGVIALLGLFLAFYKNREEIISDEYNFIRIIIYIVILLFGVVTAKWNFNRFKKNKKETISKKENLLKMMTEPKN